MKVIKRDGNIVDYNPEKIEIAINKANAEVDEGDQASSTQIKKIIKYIEGLKKRRILVEDIQDIIEEKLMEAKKYKLAKTYITYRYTRELVRKSNTTDLAIKELIDGESEYWNTENSNKNAKIVTTQRDYLAGITSTDITKRFLLPEDIVKAHESGLIHFHDADYFAQNALHNCDLINLEDMLQNGTIINGVMIEKPHRFLTAMTIATQLITAVNSSQYGGCTITLTHLAPFVRSSYDYYIKKYKKRKFSAEDVEKYAKEDLKKEIVDGVQTFQYQINSMTTTNGQAPFLSVCLYLGETEEYKDELAMIIEEVLKQRIEGMKNEKGVYVTPAFPKLIYVLDEHNCLKGGKYDYLTKLAVKCSAKRLYPDYISAKKMRENYEGNVFSPMGCRSFLSPWKNEKGEYVFEGRFNQGVVSINLPQVGIIADGDEEKFWKLLDERLELCKEALMCRHYALLGTLSDTSPIHWRYGAIARMPAGEKVDYLLNSCYSTISLGYIGIYEVTKLMKGVSHTTKEGHDFAIEVMKHLRETTDRWKKETGLGFALYGTPAESLCYRFAKIDKEKFGEIKDITDKGYYTNSYHVDVREEIDAFAKLSFESEFQKISSGGAISYVEIPNMRHNLKALEDLVKFIYENIQYAEFNTKSDYCHVCGFDGEIIINDNMEWECPNCGNKDKNKMNVTRRTCGYLGENFWNEGKTKEIKSRVLHL